MTKDERESEKIGTLFARNPHLPIVHNFLIKVMIRNIITTTALLIAALAPGACQQTPDSTNTFAVHAEIMGAGTEAAQDSVPKIKTASNIRVGTESVYAYYNEAEFILKYCGEVYIEINGNPCVPIPAKVFQLEPGTWVAEIAGGQYVKVFSKSGTTNMDVDGEFRAFAKN